MDLVESQSVDAIMSALSAMGARSTRDPARGSRRGGGVAGVDDSTHSWMSNTNTVSYKYPPQMQYYSAASARSSHGSLNDLDRRSGASSAGQSSSRAGARGRLVTRRAQTKYQQKPMGSLSAPPAAMGAGISQRCPSAIISPQARGWPRTHRPTSPSPHMAPRVAINQR